MKFAARFAILGMFLLLSSSAVYAQLRYETYTEFYDEQGEVVGYRFFNCNGGHGSGGTQTDNYVVTYVQACEPEATFSCADNGMTYVDDCESFGWCVSQSYAYSYDWNLVTDCHGCYKSQEPQCGHFTKNRLRRMPRGQKLLTAAFHAKLWEVLAVLHR